MEKLHVMVVDDEIGMRMGVLRALDDFSMNVPELSEDISLEVQQASSGEEALKKISTARPDILLLDYKLPDMTGLEVMEKVGLEKGDLLAIMITAYASLETAVTATRNGAYDFLAKPFTPAELKAAVRKAARHLILQRQAKRLAEEKRQVRFQFISVVAHELKAPLSALEGYLNIMKDHSAGDDPAVYAHMISRCLVRTEGMRKLVTDLLDLTRIESGKKKREIIDLDIREAAQAAIETSAPMAAERKIAIDLHCDRPITMQADRGELDIIFNNLVSNAVKYNRDDGRVDVTIKAIKDSVVITVKDTGIGMSAEESAKLFNDFVRIKNEKTRNILGSGLGLSIVKKLAGLYGGAVEVASQPNVGSTFTVTLMRSAADAASRQELPGQPAKAGDSAISGA